MVLIITNVTISLTCSGQALTRFYLCCVLIVGVIFFQDKPNVDMEKNVS